MLRAPNVPMTEKEFRRSKRSQFQEAIKALENLSEDSAYLPNGINRRIRRALNSIKDSRVDLLDWWEQY